MVDMKRCSCVLVVGACIVACGWKRSGDGAKADTAAVEGVEGQDATVGDPTIDPANDAGGDADAGDPRPACTCCDDDVPCPDAAAADADTAAAPFVMYATTEMPPDDDYDPRPGAGDVAACLGTALDQLLPTGVAGVTECAAFIKKPTDRDAVKSCVDGICSIPKLAVTPACIAWKAGRITEECLKVFVYYGAKCVLGGDTLDRLIDGWIKDGKPIECKSLHWIQSCRLCCTSLYGDDAIKATDCLSGCSGKPSLVK